jgi:crotonobetainyl-CoA:carnitine CoA-transferase CaiB-like acyl-CoA transferase
MRRSEPLEAVPGARGQTMTAPLSGIRIVEFVHTVMGPSCGIVLADLGADVIKVEPLTGDHTRRLTASGSGFFAMFNRNKRSIAIDLKSAAGHAVALDLIGSADVMTENFAPGTIERLKLGFDDLRRRHPRLVFASLKGFLPGPYQHRTALDEVTQMMGGLAYMTGLPGRPMRAGASVIDIAGGTYAAVAILAALIRRGITGEGAKVDSALFESTAFLVGQHMAYFAVNGKGMPPMSVRLSAWGIYDVFDLADGQLFLGLVTDNNFTRFCAEFGLDWHGEPALATNELRVAARETLVPRFQAFLKDFRLTELVPRLERAAVPFAEIRRPEDLFDDPHLNASDGLVPVTLPDGRATKLPALPIAIDGARLPRRHDLPGIGAHTDAILAELGYDAARIAALRTERAVA